MSRAAPTAPNIISLPWRAETRTLQRQNCPVVSFKMADTCIIWWNSILWFPHLILNPEQPANNWHQISSFSLDSLKQEPCSCKTSQVYVPFKMAHTCMVWLNNVLVFLTTFSATLMLNHEQPANMAPNIIAPWLLLNQKPYSSRTTMLASFKMADTCTIWWKKTDYLEVCVNSSAILPGFVYILGAPSS